MDPLTARINATRTHATTPSAITSTKTISAEPLADKFAKGDDFVFKKYFSLMF